MTQTEKLPPVTELNYCSNCHGEEYFVPDQEAASSGPFVAVCADCRKPVGICEELPNQPAKSGWLSALFGK